MKSIENLYETNVAQTYAKINRNYGVNNLNTGNKSKLRF